MKGYMDVKSFFNLGARWGWSTSRSVRFTPGKEPVPSVQEDRWAPEPVWTGGENFVPGGIRSPDRPAHSMSLYELSYSGSKFYLYISYQLDALIIIYS